jgi:hypothetical protein
MRSYSGDRSELQSSLVFHISLCHDEQLTEQLHHICHKQVCIKTCNAKDEFQSMLGRY